MPTQQDILTIIASNRYYNTNLSEQDICAKFDPESAQYDQEFVTYNSHCFVSSTAMVHPNARSNCIYFNATFNLSMNDVNMGHIFSTVLEVDPKGSMRVLDDKHRLFMLEMGEGTVRALEVKIYNGRFDVTLGFKHIQQPYTPTCMPRCTIS